MMIARASPVGLYYHLFSLLHRFPVQNKKNREQAEYYFGRDNSLTQSSAANSVSSARNSVSSARNSVSSLWHTNNRLKGTHWVRSPELSEPKKTHRARCLKPCSLKPYAAHFRKKFSESDTAESLSLALQEGRGNFNVAEKQLNPGIVETEGSYRPQQEEIQEIWLQKT